MLILAEQFPIRSHVKEYFVWPTIECGKRQSSIVPISTAFAPSTCIALS
jgi:hypothetical protein